MSVVWRAYDEVLGRAVAIKLLASRLAADPSSRTRIRAEAQAAARLSHPHIASVHDYGESDVDFGPYVVMELVDGFPLDERLDAGPMHWQEAVTTCAQLASALAAVHARGLVHRDVKPANVMLTDQGAKLVDFGISAIAGDHADSRPDHELLGTPAYLAPERLNGAPTAPATDVYALGLVLYRSLAGDLPWKADTTTEVLTAHCYLKPAPLPSIEGLPREVAEVCVQCLAKNPADRPAAYHVAQVLAGAVPRAVGPTRIVGRARRRPVAASGTLVMNGLRTRTGRAGVGVAFALAAAGLLTSTCAGAPGPRAEASALAESGDTGRATAVGAEPRVGCVVQYTTRTDAAGAFVVDVSVRNTGAVPLEDWRLKFAFPGDQRVVDLSPSTWAQQGGEVVVSGGAPLDAGGTTSLTLTGAYAAANPMPTGFSLNGTDCQGLVAPVAPAPAAPQPGTGAGSSNSGSGSSNAGNGSSNSGNGSSNSGNGSSNSGKGKKPKKPKNDD